MPQFASGLFNLGRAWHGQPMKPVSAYYGRISPKYSVPLPEEEYIQGLPLPDVADIAQGFDAVYQITEDAMSSLIGRLEGMASLKKRWGWSPPVHPFEAAIQAKEISTAGGGASGFSSFISDRTATPLGEYIYQGMCGAITFRNASLVSLGVEAQMRLTWDVEVFVAGHASTLSTPFGGDLIPLSGGGAVDDWYAPLFASGQLKVDVPVTLTADENQYTAYATLSFPAAPIEFEATRNATQPGAWDALVGFAGLEEHLKAFVDGLAEHNVRATPI